VTVKKILLVLALLGVAHSAVAQSAAALDADQVRGGWETTVDGVEHIFELRIVGDRISGAYCTVCDDATTLAFVDGQLGDSELTFTITHVRDDGSTAFQDHLHARLQDGQLLVSGQSGARDGGTISWSMHRDPRGPIAPGPPAPVVHYLQPGPWQTITPQKLVGVWLSGEGAGKQYFIIRRDGKALRGMVCGPCDNPYSMAAMEDFFVQGDTVLWNICHEDHGVGPLPYIHQIIAHVADHELHLDATQPNVRRVVSMTFLGPLPVSATARAAATTTASQSAASP
jgi:hypothetical protein